MDHYTPSTGDRRWQENPNRHTPRTFVLRDASVLTVADGRVRSVASVDAFLRGMNDEHFAGQEHAYREARAVWLSVNADFARLGSALFRQYPHLGRGADTNLVHAPADPALTREERIRRAVNMAQRIPRFEENYRIDAATFDESGNITDSPPYAYPTKGDAAVSMDEAARRYDWTAR